MKQLLLLIVTVFWSFYAKAQSEELQIEKIKNHILLQGHCYDDLREICKGVGNRLSGSEAAQKAVEWGYDKLKHLGIDSVWLQPVIVPKWQRGKESLNISYGNKKLKNIPVLSLGNSVGTDGKKLNGELLILYSIEELEQLSKDKVKDKIVFFNYHFRQDFVNTFEGYSDAAKYRWTAIMKASEKGAKAVLIRSVGTNLEDIPHTGALGYGKSKPIPAMAIGMQSADKIYALKGQRVQATMKSNCGFKDSVLSYNVIGQINGTTFPDKFIVVGGHLDSWDVGEGAHDDGAGIVQSIEVLRTFKALNIKPKHSIRAVLYMNEENGLKGGKAYADSALAKNEKHIFALESDAGGFAPIGFGLEMEDSLRQVIKSWKPLLAPLELYNFNLEHGGADISPLTHQGVPSAGLVPNSQRYFELHHTALDVFEAVNHRELKMGAVAMTALIYLVDKNFN